MPARPVRYQPVSPVLVRATTCPDDLRSLVAPDVTNPAMAVDAVREWLACQWSRPQLRAAIMAASHSLAAGVDHVLAHGDVAPKAVRGVAASIASYLLRWQRRATPFGLFAAVGTATVGTAAGDFGAEHRAVARVDADWLMGVVEDLERHAGLRPWLTVVINSSHRVCDGRLIVAAPPRAGDPAPGPVREVSVRYTGPVRLALALAAQPVRLDRLAQELAHRLPHAGIDRIDDMLDALVNGHVLITNLRPPTTVIDGLLYLISTLRAVDVEKLPADVADLLQRLESIHTNLAGHNTVVDPRRQDELREQVAGPAALVNLDAAQPITVDAVLDCRIQLPQRVFDEAAIAASVLVRLSSRPFGSTAWLEYHARFRDRYGPGALVAVRDLVADSGLGYPSGFLGAAKARPTWRAVTERDARLVELIQHAMLDGADEIRLTDDDIDTLAIGDQSTVVPPARVELGIAISATSTSALDRGEFELRITAAPHSCTSMAGRFAYLLEPSIRKQLKASYTAGVPDEVMVAQVSFPPRRVHNDNVTRVGRILDDVVSVGEHPDGETISLDDLAVTADAEQLYLVHVPSGRPVLAYIPHALDTVVQTPPLARFIAEIAESRSSVFGPVDLGAAARSLPYVPRIRYRRTVLAPARWVLNPADVGSPDDLTEWRRRLRVPAGVVACRGELRLPLDLDQPLDRALLRRELSRGHALELRDDVRRHGLGRPTEILVPMALHTPTHRQLPHTAAPGAVHRPGSSTVIHAQLAGNPARFDQLLASAIPMLAQQLGELGVQRWWAGRHRDLIRDDNTHHISIFMRVDESSMFGTIAARLAELAADLHSRGLPAQLSFATYHEQPARYGHGPALQAAERVFAADTATAIAQLRLAVGGDTNGQAIAAASMVRLAAGFAPDPVTGYRMLLDCLDRGTKPADRGLADLARGLAEPTGTRVGGLPGGKDVAAAWQARDQALQAYRAALLNQRDPDGVLRSLLHEHHVRAVGVDPEVERTTGRLARSAALHYLATGRTA